MSEKLYTLAEARVELTRVECDNKGHDLRVELRPNTTGPAWHGDPKTVLCQRCERKWRVEPDGAGS